MTKILCSFSYLSILSIFFSVKIYTISIADFSSIVFFFKNYLLLRLCLIIVFFCASAYKNLLLSFSFDASWNLLLRDACWRNSIILLKIITEYNTDYRSGLVAENSLAYWTSLKQSIGNPILHLMPRTGY